MRVPAMRRLVVMGGVLAALVAAGSLSLSAQTARTVRGSVVDSTGNPVPGALVATMNASGELVAQTLAGADGAFEIQLLTDAQVDVYAMRVGYEPSQFVPVTAESVNERITLVASATRARLSDDRRRQRGVCGAPRDSASDVTRLWQEARKAIASTGLLFGREAPSASVTLFDRTTSPDGKTVLSEQSRESNAASRRPFRSLSVDSAAVFGLVIESENDVSYYAPDADVLLSKAFADSHCFGFAAASPSHASWIGLTFKPKSERAGVHEVSGTMWFERESLELRRLEYLYTNEPAAFAAAGVGGELRFAHLGNGMWLISRWEIRMPQGQIQSRIALQHSQVRDEKHVTVGSLRVSGGEVRAIVIGAAVMAVPKD